MRLVLLTIIILCLVGNISAGWQDDFDSRGYLREMAVWWQFSPESSEIQEWGFINDLHLRQNFRWYPSNAVIVGLELEADVLKGENSDYIINDETVTLGSTIFYAGIDRAWIDWSIGSLQIRGGRQRIAWGTSMVWNPIDLFNRASPLDFFNVEKPGTDAVCCQYYLGMNSKVELAYEHDSDPDESVTAAKLQLNGWSYDWHFLVGRSGSNFVTGFAWVGDVLSGGFRGEILYTRPRKYYRYDDWQRTILAEEAKPFSVVSIDADYTFENSLYLHTGLLYNEHGTTGKAGGEHIFESLERGALSPSKMSLCYEIRYIPHPLVATNIMSIANPHDGSLLIAPSFTWSVVTNTDLTLTGLLFNGDDQTEFGDSGDMILLKIKYSY